MAREMTPQERAAAQVEVRQALADKVKNLIVSNLTHEENQLWLANVDAFEERAYQRGRRAALLEAAQQVCMHCGKRAIGLQVGVTGPNAAGNYVHNPPEDSRVKESALCSATSIWSLIRYEDRLAQEGA